MVGCGEMIGIGRWRPVTERGMRPRRVVVSDPSSDDLASLIEIEEQALVEKFVAHAAVEGFDVGILHRLAGRDVVPFHLMLFAPAPDRIRGELGAVIPHLRARSAVIAPASCARKTPMIFSSVNLPRIIVPPSSRAGL